MLKNNLANKTYPKPLIYIFITNVKETQLGKISKRNFTVLFHFMHLKKRGWDIKAPKVMRWNTRWKLQQIIDFDFPFLSSNLPSKKSKEINSLPSRNWNRQTEDWWWRRFIGRIIRPVLQKKHKRKETAEFTIALSNKYN